MMRVIPDLIGGEFEWTDGCCPVTGSGRVFSFSCNATCLCTGCYPSGFLVYEGYSIPVTGGHCGCSCGPHQALTVPDGEQMVAGVSASFSPEAVIFEDTYTNRPGEVVYGRSTEAVLSCEVHGGFRGGTATFAFAGETNLVWIRGAAVPQTSVAIPPGEKLEFAAAYEGLRPSAEAEDITYTVTFTENDTTNAPTVVEAKLTSVKVQLRALNSAQSNPNENRHVFGVHEWVEFFSFPHSEAPVLQILSADEDLIGADNEMFFCPWQGGSYRLRIVAHGATYDAGLSVIEPEVVCRDVWWNDIGVMGMAGLLDMRLALYVEPTYVSFKNLYMEEIPDDDPCPHFGYFSTGSLAKTGALSHSLAAHAGVWGAVKGDGSWMADRAGRETAYPQPWSDGWKEWRIPVGWGDYLRNVKGRILPNPTSQRFELDADGTARIMKYNHVLTRTPSNDVWLDGVRQR